MIPYSDYLELHFLAVTYGISLAETILSEEQWILLDGWLQEQTINHLKSELNYLRYLELHRMAVDRGFLRPIDVMPKEKWMLLMVEAQERNIDYLEELLNGVYHYYGLPLYEVKPYEEGTEPVPFDFHIHDTYPPVIMQGYNFSDDTLQAGIPVIFVLDMFQRLVYSKKVQEEPITTAQIGRIEEPVVSSPYRRYAPNFVGTNHEGVLVEKSKRDTLPAYKHHLSCGFVRLEGKYYAPIQVTYHGGEEFL